MNGKNLIILTIVTLVVVTIAVILTQKKQNAPNQQDALFFPNLMSEIEDIMEINIVTKQETTTLVKKNQQWQMQEKYFYPVSSDKVHKLLLGMANLSIIEAKTSHPERYTKIGVEEPTNDNAKSSLVSLKKSGSETLVSLIIGNDRIAKIDSTRREIYVRKAGEKQAWLALGQLSIEEQVQNWLDQNIMDVSGDKIRQVKIIQADKEDIVIFKDSPDDEQFQLADLPDDTNIKQAYMLDNISTTLSRLDFDDVVSEIEFQTTLTAIFNTFDGLEVIMDIMDQEGKYYAKFIANVDAKVETKEGETDVKTIAAELNTKLGNWIYELAKYKVDDLIKERSEFISESMPIDEKTTDNTLPPLGDIDAFSVDTLSSPFSANMNINEPSKEMLELESALGTPSTVAD